MSAHPMMLNDFSLVFVSALALNLMLQCWLGVRHLRHVARHRECVPADFEEKITLAKHRRAADYTRARTRTAMVDQWIGAALLLAWTFGGGLDVLDAAWRAVPAPALAQGVGLIVSAFLILGALDVPMSAYQTFVIEERFGFNKVTPRLFVADLLKHTLLLIALGVPLGALVLWVMQVAGALWWIHVWLVWMVFGLAMVWLYPVLIAPLFNRFSALEDEDLRLRISNLLERNGLSMSGIFVMDGSRRSGHGNAYFTGLGKNKRIVFFDTLLEGLDAAEIEAVLAHEVGHFRNKHVLKQIAFRATLSLAGLALLGWLSDAAWFYQGLGVSRPSAPLALLLFLFVVPQFTFFLQPIGAWLSRKHEFEADDFAVSQAEPGSLARALVKLYRDNANTLTPDPWYSAFHDSHPPAPVRIAHLGAAPIAPPASARLTPPASTPRLVDRSA